MQNDYSERRVGAGKQRSQKKGYDSSERRAKDFVSFLKLTR